MQANHEIMKVYLNQFTHLIEKLNVIFNNSIQTLWFKHGFLLSIKQGIIYMQSKIIEEMLKAALKFGCILSFA